MERRGDQARTSASLLRAKKKAPNPNNPNLGFFPGSSFSTREASNFSIFRWIFQRWHLWSLPKLPELVWNSKRIPPIYSETFRLHHVCFTLNIKNYFKVCTTTLQILRRLGPGNCMCLIKHFRIISLVIIIELKRIFLIHHQRMAWSHHDTTTITPPSSSNTKKLHH